MVTPDHAHLKSVADQRVAAAPRAGITISAVAFNLLAGSITNTSPIVSHTF